MLNRSNLGFLLAFILVSLCLAYNTLMIHGNINLSLKGKTPLAHSQGIYHFNPWVVDDAYISMRYAENFAQGKGLVFNEGEPVEGYTTYTWVVLLGLLNKAGLDLVIITPILCLIFSVLTLLLFFFVPYVIPNTPPSSGTIGMILLGTSGIFTIWASGSMEVPLAQFLLLLSILFHVKARETQDLFRWNFPTAMLCVLIAMTRPEGILIFLLYFADRFYLSFKNNNASYFLFGFYFSMIFAPYLLWRYSFYGYILPNTFYAKVGSNLLEQTKDGLVYFAKFASNALFIIAPAITVLVSGAARPVNLKALCAPLIASIAIIIFMITAAGDHMPASRLLAPTLPAFCIASGIVLASLAAKTRYLFLIALLVLCWQQANFYIAKDNYKRTVTGNVGRSGKIIGKWMQKNLPENSLIATNTAGSIPFFSKLPAIDMLGLNDEHIAHREIRNMGAGMVGHEKGDGRYVLSRKPDYIQFGSSHGSQQPSFLSGREIMSSREFRNLYTLQRYRVGGGHSLILYKRNDVPAQQTERTNPPPRKSVRKRNKPAQSTLNRGNSEKAE